MFQAGRIAAMIVIFAATTVAWFVLAGVMQLRTEAQESDLASAVSELWGQPMQQNAPTVNIERRVTQDQVETVTGPDGQTLYEPDGSPRQRTRRVETVVWEPTTVASTDVTVDLDLDQRRKGLLWFSLYDVDFAGAWTWHNPETEPVTLRVAFVFPVSDAMYDDFRFTVNGVESWDAVPQGGQVSTDLRVPAGGDVAFGASYRSRGRDAFTYSPVADWQVAEVRDLKLAMTTDFDAIDFPAQTLSPTRREDTAAGQSLAWEFRRVVTGHGMGMVMPSRLQAGPLGSAMAMSAPISLGLYMVWIFVLGLLKKVEVHPINHLFLAAAFFAFHLLFAYSADRLPVEAAFGLSAATSLFLTTSYLRLVVGGRFALVEAGIAQLLYQVGFSLAHFFDGATGLTITLLGIGTLYALMQLTGRIRWQEVFDTAPAAPAPTATPTTATGEAPRSYT